jgi:hypothetical protein
MKEKIGLKSLFTHILVGIFLFSISVSAYCLSQQVRGELLKKEGQSNKHMIEAEEQEVPKKEEKIHSEAPAYNEVEFISIVGEFFVNPQYTGRITTVRTFPKVGSPRDNPVVDVRETDDGWEKVIVSQSESDAESIIATGRMGSLKISLPKRKPLAKSDKLQQLGDLIISFGDLYATLIMPSAEISQPGSFEVSVSDPKENNFIKGDIIAIRKDEVAVNFHELSSNVVNEDGKVRINLKKPGGDSFQADLKAWGYNILIPDTGTGKPASITAKVFGLPNDVKLKFTFESLPGQNVTPSTTTFPVRKINMGASLGTITTSIPGPQALSVSVERVN